VAKSHDGFAFFVFDGVRQNVPHCDDVLGYLNATFGNNVKGIRVTSLQFNIKGGDGTGGLSGIDQYMTIHSWDKSDFVDAYCSRFKTKDELLTLLATDTDDQCFDMKINDFTDKEKDLDRKFYYAGGSARFMFDYSLTELIEEVLPKLLISMTSNLWDEFASLQIHVGSESAVNSLMQILGDKIEGEYGTKASRAFPVSKYVLHLAYEKCRSKLVKAFGIAARMAGNPVLQGWAFEMEQIHLIRLAIQANKPLVSADRTVILPTGCSIGKATFKNIIILDETENSNSFVIECLSWNQGCFDIALYHLGELVTIQFTTAPAHSLKISYINLLKKHWRMRAKKCNISPPHCHRGRLRYC